VRLATTLIVILLTGAPAMAYESSYEPTPVGAVELKDLPQARALEATGPADYFEGANETFRKLFRYIRSNDLPMTVPVEADVEPARMRFFVPREVTRSLPTGQGGVTVLSVPARKVISAGIRGSYSRAGFEKGVAMLRAWLDAHPEWLSDGEPYAVYWNGPFTPWFLKRSEVHIRVLSR
jgi:hypothetical protein